MREAPAKRVMERLVVLGARLVARCDDEYPLGLLDLSDPPSLLFMIGRAPAAGGTAIVGTRMPSEAGLRMAENLARRAPAPIVSGLARGIDAAAHRGALAAGVPTIAYIGTGLGLTYPPEHRTLQRSIVEAGGTVISERLPDEPVTQWALVRRDRLQAAHADRTVLIETETTGGAMHTLRFAAQLNRARYALEPRTDDSRTQGNSTAIARGALSLPWEAEEALRRLTIG